MDKESEFVPFDLDVWNLLGRNRNILYYDCERWDSGEKHIIGGGCYDDCFKIENDVWLLRKNKEINTPFLPLDHKEYIESYGAVRIWIKIKA